MRKRIGIAVLKSELRAALVVAGTVRWRDEESLGDADTLADSLSRLLTRAPRSAHGARVTIALGGDWVQVRRLGGLPKVESVRVLTALVRENERSFFLWKGVPSVIPEVEVRTSGDVWGAAFDRRTIEGIEQAARQTRMTIRHVSPIARLGSPPAGPANEDALAVAAALASRRLALSWRLRPDAARALRRAHAARGGVAAAFAATLAFTALGPGIRAGRTAREAARELARHKAEADTLARTQLELQRVSRRLARIEAFQMERGQVTRLLAALSESTPDSTALLTLRVDSAEGTLTVMAPRAADVLPTLNDLRGVFAPRIVSAITREAVGGAPVERASIRFRRSPVRGSPVRPAAR